MKNRKIIICLGLIGTLAILFEIISGSTGTGMLGRIGVILSLVMFFLLITNIAEKSFSKSYPPKEYIPTDEVQYEKKLEAPVSERNEAVFYGKEIVSEIPERNEDDKLLQNFWISHVTGCYYEHWESNPQIYIPQLSVGERVFLYADTENLYDDTAIAIFNYQNKFLGWYPAKSYMAEELYIRLLKEEKVFANVAELGKGDFRVNIGVYAYTGESLEKMAPVYQHELLEEFPETDEKGYYISSNALANVYGVSKHYNGFPAQRAIRNLEICERVFLRVENGEIHVYTQTGKMIGYTHLSKKSDEILKEGGTVLARVEVTGVNDAGIQWLSIRVASYNKQKKKK